MTRKPRHPSFLFHPLKRQRRWQVLLALAVECTLLGNIWLLPGLAQAPAPETPTTAAPPASDGPILESFRSLTPTGVQALFTSDSSAIATAPVQLDGNTIFVVAAPVVQTQAGETRPLSARQRAREIERRLREILRQGIDPTSLDVSQAFDPQSNQPLISVNGTFLATVTFLDAQSQGYGNLSLRAQEIVASVRAALQRYHSERQPTFLKRQAILAIAIALAMGLVQLLLQVLKKRLNHYRQTLNAPTLPQPGTSPEPTTHPDQSAGWTSAATLRQRCQMRIQFGIADFGQVLLRLGQGVNSGGGLYLLLGLFPYTRWMQTAMLSLLRLPMALGILGLATYWLIRLGTVWIDRLFAVLQEGAVLAPRRSQRLELRFSTFSQVVKGVLYLLTFLIAITIALGLLGVRLGPILTGAGLLGLAFSLASQNLIQDFINGFLILLEDQYGVGDVIMVDVHSGMVEAMNLRITQLRNEEGRLITIPNSKIGIVQNLSKEWSRVDVTIPVALTANLDLALSEVKQVAAAMQQDEMWGHLILEPPLLLGVDRLDHVGASIRIWIKTQPLKQWDVAREYRRRLKLCFDQAGIEIGVPQQVVHGRVFTTIH